jgi:hypothetical protein
MKPLNASERGVESGSVEELSGERRERHSSRPVRTEVRVEERVVRSHCSSRAYNFPPQYISRGGESGGCGTAEARSSSIVILVLVAL